MIKYILLFLFYFYISNVLSGQPDDLQEQPLDSVLSWLKANYNNDSIDVYAIGQQAIERASNSDDLKLKGDLHVAVGDWVGYTGLRSQDSLLAHDYRALAFYEELGNDTLLASIYGSLAMDLLNGKQLDASQAATFKSIELHESIGDQGGIANAHRSLSYLHEMMGEPLVAIDYADKALAYYKSVDDYARMTYTLLSKIESYKAAGMLKEARAAGLACIDIVNTKVPDEVFVLGRAYSRLSEVSIEEGNLDQGFAESKKAFEIVAGAVGEKRASSYKQGMADALRLQKKYSQAIEIYAELIADTEEKGTGGDYSLLYKHIYECYKNVGDNKNALDNLEQYTKLENQQYEQTIENLKSEAVVKYETAEKDKSIAIQEAEIKQKSKIQNLTYGALATLLTLLGSLFYFYQQNKKVTAALNVKNEENQLLVKEIHHRVKNNLQILSSLLSLQSDAEENEAVLGALQEGRNRVESMGMIHQRLYSQDTLSAINMKEYVRDLCDYLQDMASEKSATIQIQSDIKIGLADIETAIPLGLIVNELITNSIKYAGNETEAVLIDVSMWEDDNSNLCLCVSDNGTASVDQVESTKSTNFGSKLVGILSKKLKGAIEINNTNGYATTITFSRYKLI